MIKYIFLFVVIILLTASHNYAQDKNKKIDASKPTNLYTQFNLNAEYTDANSYKLYGVRTNIQYAFNPDNLLLVEVPLLRNSLTEKTGLGDIRFRYFNVPKRNLSKNITAMVLGLDVTVPTGKYEDGLGLKSWSIAPTFIVGIMLTPKIFLFPGVSYIHKTKPDINNVTTYSSNGIGLQTNMSIVFYPKLFLFVNPIVTLLNTNDIWKDIWQLESNLNYMVTPNKLKLNATYLPNFTSKTHTFRIGITFYF